MTKHSKTSLGKLNQEELQAIATEMGVKFQKEPTKPELVVAILFDQVTAENAQLAEELKNLKADKATVDNELAEANTVITEQTEKIESLSAELAAAPVSTAENKETVIDASEFTKVKGKEVTLKPKLKEVCLDGKTYTRAEALKDVEVMGKLVKNNYPHIITK